MRIVLAVAAAVVLTACSSTQRVGRGASSPDVAEAPSGDDGECTTCQPPSFGGAPAPAVAAAGPMEAAALARETGLQYQDLGASVLLSNDVVRARFFPGVDTMSIDGRTTSMGTIARREAAGLVVPASGVDAVRRAARASVARRGDVSSKSLTIAAPAPMPKAPALKPIDVPVPKPVASRGATGGDAAWSALAAAERPWRYIVIHHSDDHEGCFAKYDRVHLQKGWENGCGYHFVIGNGTQSGDGEVEVASRWVRQIQGAHAKTDDNRFNDYGVGVVLVGDFERGGRPSARQYESLVRLTKWLMARYGVTPDRVLRHSDCKSTACPGKNFPWAKFLSDIT